MVGVHYIFLLHKFVHKFVLSFRGFGQLRYIFTFLEVKLWPCVYMYFINKLCPENKKKNNNIMH